MIFAVVAMAFCGILGIAVSYAVAKHALREIDRMGDRLRTSDPMALSVLRRADVEEPTVKRNEAPAHAINLDTILGDTGG